MCHILSINLSITRVTGKPHSQPQCSCAGTDWEAYIQWPDINIGVQWHINGCQLKPSKPLDPYYSERIEAIRRGCEVLEAATSTHPWPADEFAVRVNVPPFQQLLLGEARAGGSEAEEAPQQVPRARHQGQGAAGERQEEEGTGVLKELHGMLMFINNQKVSCNHIHCNAFAFTASHLHSQGEEGPPPNS